MKSPDLFWRGISEQEHLFRFGLIRALDPFKESRRQHCAVFQPVPGRHPEEMMTLIPNSMGKISIDGLGAVVRETWDEETRLPLDAARLYSRQNGRLTYDFLWRPRPGATRLFVLFSGDALRSKNNPPVFQRWSWAEHFPGHCLYFSDPTLYLNDKLGLAWYVGTEGHSAMKRIAKQVMVMTRQLGLKARDVYAYGSSGGGFAALSLLHHMPEAAAIAINPQTSILAYERRSVEKFLNICFKKRDRETALREFGPRLSMVVEPDRLTGKRIAVIQNRLDTHHYEDHFKPFCAALGTDHDAAPEDPVLRRILFDHPGGHRKAETPEVFGMIMTQVTEGRF